MATKEEYIQTLIEALNESRARSLQYNIYKGKGGKMGAIQFSVKSANTSSGNIKERTQGMLFIQAAPATAPDIYDWENKITLGLSVDELGTLMNSLVRNQEAKLYHDASKSKYSQSKAQKQLWLSPGSKTPGTFLLNLSEKEGQNQKKVLISISQGEARTLYNLFGHAQALMLGWV